MAIEIEIVDFPIEHGGSFHRFLYVYQRVLRWAMGLAKWLVTISMAICNSKLLVYQRVPNSWMV